MQDDTEDQQVRTELNGLNAVTASAAFGPIGAIIGGVAGGILFAVMTDRLLDATLPVMSKL